MSDESESKRTRFEWWLEDLSTDPATRVAGAVLIIFGSILGVMTGSLHISADIGEVLSGQLDDSGQKADVNGAVFAALINNSSGAEGMEGVTVILYDDENLEHLWKETSSWQENDILNLYQEVPYKGLNSNFINSPLYEHGKNLLNLANKGLEKRGYLNSEGKDESVHLEKLYNIVEKQKNPADLLIEEEILKLISSTGHTKL